LQPKIVLTTKGLNTYSTSQGAYHKGAQIYWHS